MAFRARIHRAAAGLAARPCRPSSSSYSIPARLRSYSQATSVPTSNLGSHVQQNIAVSICSITELCLAHR